jgi:hypothetical protein
VKSLVCQVFRCPDGVKVSRWSNWWKSVQMLLADSKFTQILRQSCCWLRTHSPTLTVTGIVSAAEGRMGWPGVRSTGHNIRLGKVHHQAFEAGTSNQSAN